MPHQCVTCERLFDDGSKEMLTGCPDCGGNTFQYFKGEPPEQPPESPPERAGGSAVAETVGRATTTLRDAVSSATGEGFDAWPHQGDTEVDASQLRGDGTSAGTDQSGSGPRDAEFVEDDSDVEPDEHEDSVQSSARSDVVSGEELPGGALPEEMAEGLDDTAEPTSTETSGMDTKLGPETEPSEPPAPEQDDAGRTEPEEATGEATTPTGTPTDATADATPDGSSAEGPDLATLREELNDQFEGIRVLDPGQYELNLMELYEREETIIALRENGRYVIEVPETWRGD